MLEMELIVAQKQIQLGHWEAVAEQEVRHQM
jgi:hypothetical protein